MKLFQDNIKILGVFFYMDKNKKLYIVYGMDLAKNMIGIVILIRY